MNELISELFKLLEIKKKEVKYIIMPSISPLYKEEWMYGAKVIYDDSFGGIKVLAEDGDFAVFCEDGIITKDNNGKLRVALPKGLSKSGREFFEKLKVVAGEK